jgi:hypothetical protein
MAFEMYLPPGGSMPVPVNRDVSLQKLAESNLDVVARSEYCGDDERFVGKTKLEAAVLSLADDAAHDPGARTEFLDRIMGKARQRTENLNVDVTLTDFLKQVEEKEYDGRHNDRSAEEDFFTLA